MWKWVSKSLIALAIMQGCSAEPEAVTDAPLATQPSQPVAGMQGPPPPVMTPTNTAVPTPTMVPNPVTPPAPSVDPIPAPDTMTPDTMTPDTMTPDTMMPDTMMPDTMMPDTMMPNTGEGPQPKIPAVSGDCPDFRDGSTISVAGHGGVVITAGSPGMGGPLLFYWHGTGSSPREAMSILPAGVRQDIVSSGGIIASFDGRRSSGTEGDCSGTNAHNMADFKAVDQITACAVQNHGIDPRRIYSTGCSAGGLQTGCLATLRSSYIAAVTPNSGGAVFAQRLEDPSHVPAMMTMHGGSGDNVIVNFGTTSNTLGTAFKGAGGFWVDCNHMSGHCGARGAIQESAWEFLKAHPFGTDPSPYAGGLPSSFPDYCEIK